MDSATTYSQAHTLLVVCRLALFSLPEVQVGLQARLCACLGLQVSKGFVYGVYWVYKDSRLGSHTRRPQDLL